MKIFLIMSFLFWFSWSVGYTQTSYPMGVYMSLEEILKKQPSKKYKILVKPRTSGDITMNGGNDYAVISVDDSLKKKTIKKVIWAVADTNGVYLNCYHHKCQLWYAKVEEEKDSILVFKAAIPNAEAASAAATAGVFGGAIGGAVVGASMAKKRYSYYLNLFTGKVILLRK